MAIAVRSDERAIERRQLLGCSIRQVSKLFVTLGSNPLIRPPFSGIDPVIRGSANHLTTHLANRTSKQTKNLMCGLWAHFRGGLQMISGPPDLRG